MNPIRQFAHAVKATAATTIGILFGRRTSQWWTWGGSPVNRDYARAVGDGSGSSIVVAICLWICRTFPEAPVRVSTMNAKGELSPDPKHRLGRLLARPNPYYSGTLLWWGTLWDFTLTGNAYWLKERSLGGLVVRLWWVPSWTMEPAWSVDGSDYLHHYEYRPDMSMLAPIKYPPSEVVHFRLGLDPHNIRKGLSPLASLIREIFTDDEAAQFTASLLRNLGVPGLVISPPSAKEDAFRLDKDDAEWIKQEAEQRYGGDNRGRAMVLGQPMDVKVLSFSPDQMKMKDMRRIPEERACAVVGIPAVVVGLGAGIDRSTFNNFENAKASAYEANILPTQALFSEELNTQLVPDFTSNPDALVIDFDTSQVRILQPDQDAIHARAREDWLAGVITLDEALQELGREPLEAGAGLVRFIPNTGTLTHVDNVLPIAQAATAPLPSGGSRTALPQGPSPAKALSGRKDANDAAGGHENGHVVANGSLT